MTGQRFPNDLFFIVLCLFDYFGHMLKSLVNEVHIFVGILDRCAVLCNACKLLSNDSRCIAMISIMFVLNILYRICDVIR